MAGYKFQHGEYTGEDIKSKELIEWLNNIPERYRDDMKEGEYEIFLAVVHHLINRIESLAERFYKRIVKCDNPAESDESGVISIED